MQPDGQSGDAVTSAASLPARGAFALAWLAGIASTLLVLVVLGVIAWAVAQRYFIGRPLLWADDLSGYLLVAMVGLGAAEALRRRDHIAIDLLSGPTGRGAGRLAEVWSAFAVLAFAAILAWSTWGQITFAYDFESYTPGEIEIPSWIPQLPLLIGWLLLGLVAIGQLIEAVTRELRR